MKQIIVVCVLLAFMLACDGKPSPSQGKPEVLPVPKVTIEKEKVEKEEPLPPEVKIKLKRDGKDNYSWELSGSDVNEIIKINEKLRKNLGVEQQK
ncbi:MAG: hypothetical protein Q8N70_10610 [Deltaproteobacteria bacterium]|nr:hypothetical protein [Deltaproteobacteria bacterium]